MKFFVLALFSLGLLSGLFCDLRADNSIRMYLDYARFRYDDEQTYLEIYYSIHRQTAAATATQVPLKFYLNDTKSATTLASSELALTIDKQSAEGMQGSVIKTVLPPGEYQIKMVRMASETQTRVDSVHYSFSTTPFQSEKIKLSDLELCSNIAQRSAKSSSLFFKNTMEVYPNPTHLFGLNNPNVFYYIELYNIRPGAGEKDLEIQVAVKDGEGNTVEQKSYNRNRQNESLVEVGSFNVSEYRSGLYTLVFAVIDHGKDYSVLNINNFYVLNPGSMPAGEEEMLAGFPSSRFFTMGGADLDQRFAQARFVATPREVEIYRSLGEMESKRIFLYKFWFEREKDHPGLQTEYYNRADYASDEYGYAGREGWETDMGRVYIMYGEPDRVIGSAASFADEKPYTIWVYHDLEGGVRFLFIDESGVNDYRLVSSDLRGELHDPSYDGYLYLQGER